MLLSRAQGTCACFLVLLGASAAQISNAPIADTYFETYGSEDKNFGTSESLRMDQWGGRQVFLRFDLSNVPRSERITSAQLRLRIIEVGMNEAGEFPDLPTCIRIHPVITPWTEEGLTFRTADGQRAWNQGPGIGEAKYGDVGPLKQRDLGPAEPIFTVKPALLAPGKWLELDLTDLVRRARRLGSNEVNIVLRSATLGRSYTFNSREDKELSKRPQLVVSTDAAQPDFFAPNPLVTDWVSGKEVSTPLRISTGVPSSQFEANLIAMPHPGATVAVTNGKVALIPNAAGRYVVQVVPASASSERSRERVTFDVLSLRKHPRMYVTDETLARMREEARSGARLTKAFLDWTRSGSSRASEGRFHDMGPHEGCENNSLAWMITSDSGFLSNAVAYANQVLRKPMREHFQDVHEATFTGAAWVHAIALHYDWCHAALDPAHRTRVADWLHEAAVWAEARSGAPIAHNDGGARQCLLGSASLALLGDFSFAESLYKMSRDNFDEALLPWLNDGGSGGRSGDGGEYEGLHGFFIVKYAWMSLTAAGEDLFSTTPFFENRMRHILFGWYPRTLVDRSGSFSMRQYYSPSGDHTRMGYVGDTQPYQSTAALCWRYANTETAQGLRWLAGKWPTQWMQYTLRWAVLGGFESLKAKEPRDLAYVDRGCNTLYARSDWSDDATWVLFENAPFVSAHGSLDSGGFEIFKGDLLAARTGNMDHANVGAKHSMNYLHRTIAANSLLIHDPKERWKGFLGGAEGTDDGGGQRTNFPLGASPDAETYVNYRKVFQRGQLTRYKLEPGFAYAMSDLTPAYNSPYFHGGSLNHPKVSSVSRQLLYVREVDSVIVFDRVKTLDPFKVTWLLHSLGELNVVDGNETAVSEGQFKYTGASKAVITHGWPKPVPSFGRCLSVTLWPENPSFEKIGGRTTLPAGQTEGFPGDQWHGKHLHHHMKDFWVAGTNYPPGNPPETRWFGEPGSSYYVEGTPDESGGRGKWRLEVSPDHLNSENSFLHVLCPRLGKEGPFPNVERLSAEAFHGALVSEGDRKAAVFFCAEERSRPGLAVNLPGEGWELWIADLEPGSYSVETGGKQSGVTVDSSRILHLTAAGGRTSVAVK